MAGRAKIMTANSNPLIAACHTAGTVRSRRDWWRSRSHRSSAGSSPRFRKTTRICWFPLTKEASNIGSLDVKRLAQLAGQSIGTALALPCRAV